MELQRNNSSSPSSSNSSSSVIATPNPHKTPSAAPSADPMHSWWESVSKARSRIHALAALLPSASASLASLADSDRPALSLLSSPAAYSAISSSLSGHHSDPLCHWLYDTFLSDDPHLRLVVLSFVPLLTSLYLSRIHSPDLPSLSGFEALLLALYAAETKSRNGKPLLLTIPDLSLPSIYHTPLRKPSSSPSSHSHSPSVAIISPPLEPQIAIKSTKRPCIVGVALHSFFSQISQMPSWSKLDFCRFAASWAAHDCPCRTQFDRPHPTCDGHAMNGNGVNGEIEEVVQAMGDVKIRNGGDDSSSSSSSSVCEPSKGERIPLPWEILQPTLRILGHCLLGPLNSEDVKDVAAFAVRSLYARASHDLVPQAILATRSLIQLDIRTREAAMANANANANANSNANTPTKAKKPEILLVSK